MPQLGLAAIVPKDEFIKVDLELGFAHTVVSADQPLLQVANGPVGKWDNGLRALPQLRPEGLRTGNMFEAGLREVCEALETVGIDDGTGLDILGQERDYRRRLEVGESPSCEIGR